MKATAFSRQQGARGSVLVVTVILVVLTAMAAVLMTKILIGHQRLNNRRFEYARQFHLAEAGVDMVLNWGNFPDQYTDDSDLFWRDTSSMDETNLAACFPNLASALSSGDPVTLSWDSDEFGVFTSSEGEYVGKVNNIRLLPADPANDPVTCLFKVESTAEGAFGFETRQSDGAVTDQEYTVLAYFRANPLAIGRIQLPAAMISLKTAATAGGNGKIHWGEAWSKQSFNLTPVGPSNMSYVSGDPHAIYRTESTMSFANPWKDLGLDPTVNNPDVDTRINWPAGADLLTAPPPSGIGLGNYANHFHQRIPSGVLNFPDFRARYAEFKQMAIDNNRYYTTDASGNIYQDGTLIDFDDEFTNVDRDAAPYDLLFIDTIDGNPPAADGSNLATITTSGDAGLKGVYYICANFAATGAGNPPSCTAINRANQEVDLLKIYLDGVFYSAGTLALGGNKGVYGCVVTDGGFTGNGTPDIYYNQELVNGLEFNRGNIGSTFRVAMQKSYGYKP